MNTNDQPTNPDPAQPDSESAAQSKEQIREFEKSGCYPETGKPFRLWALLGWLTLLVAALAVVAALLNMLLLDNP